MQIPPLDRSTPRTTTTFWLGLEVLHAMDVHDGTGVVRRQRLRGGVACADCHMPYERQGAVKVSSHHVRSPMLSVARSCQTCHRYDETEIKARVQTIQDRTKKLLESAETAVVDLINAIEAAQKAGVKDAQLEPARALQRKAQFRADFVNAENSMGFHAPQEAARILAESIDYARQGQLEVIKIMPR